VYQDRYEDISQTWFDYWIANNLEHLDDQVGEEDIDTGTDVDKVERENAYAIDLVLTAVGGSGNFIVDEEIYQGASLAAATAKGIVASWDSANKTVRVNTVVGTFAAPKKVTGETSGAYYDQASVDDQALPTVPYADNKILETDGDNILDFTELDPWSEGDL